MAGSSPTSGTIRPGPEAGSIAVDVVDSSSSHRSDPPQPTALSRGPSGHSRLHKVPDSPVIEKYTGRMAAVDVFTASTAFWVMESIRLDLGYGSQVHP